MSCKISGKHTVIGCIILVVALLIDLCPAKLRVGAKDTVFNISSVEDLLEAQEYLETHIDHVILNQTCDIQVSPYNYIYRRDAHRIEIRYGEETEAYYDVRDGYYYESLTATGAAISYDWKVSSWKPLGQDSLSIYKYRGNGHTIEGIYQRKASTNKVTDTGVFYRAQSIQGVMIKNYFGIGRNLDRLSILGNHIQLSEECGSENAQLITDNDSSATDVGFVGRLSATETIRGARVNANIFKVNTSLKDYSDPDYYWDNNQGLLIGKMEEGSVAEDSYTSGIIGNGRDKCGAVGGVAGRLNGGYDSGRNRWTQIRNCTSDAVIDGRAWRAGGIAGECHFGEIVIENCCFRGKIMQQKISSESDTGFCYSGGVCGLQSCGVIQNCVNEGNVQGYYGYYGGITGWLTGGEIINCINEGTVAGGGAATIMFGDAAIYGYGDFQAGGIAGRIYYKKDATFTWCSIINCGNRGNVSSLSGPAAGIVAYQEGAPTEIINVWNTAQITGTLEADSVTGISISGSRENCLDGRESTPEELCKKLNQWIASADMDDHYTWEEFDEMYPWKVENGTLELVLTTEPVVSTEPPKPTEAAGNRENITPKPTEAAGNRENITPKPTEAAGNRENITPKPTEAAGDRENITPKPTEAAGNRENITPKPTKAAGDRENITPKPTEAAGDRENITPKPTEAAGDRENITPKPTEAAGDRENITPKPTEAAGNRENISPKPTGNTGGTELSTPDPVNPPNPAGSSIPAMSAKPKEGAATSRPSGKKDTKSSDAKTNNKKAGKPTLEKTKKKAAPVFTLSRKKNKKGQKYILLRVKKGEGKYIEVWAKVKGISYKKMKLSENRLARLNNKMKFKYSVSGRHYYFKLRTYQIKKGKKVYSKMSSQKGIITR